MRLVKLQLRQVKDQPFPSSPILPLWHICTELYITYVHLFFLLLKLDYNHLTVSHFCVKSLFCGYFTLLLTYSCMALLFFLLFCPALIMIENFAYSMGFSRFYCLCVCHASKTLLPITFYWDVLCMLAILRIVNYSLVMSLV